MWRWVDVEMCRCEDVLDVEMWRSGEVEMWWRCVDQGDVEMWWRCVNVEMCRCGDYVDVEMLLALVRC